MTAHFRVTGEAIVAEGGRGPLRYKLIARGNALGLFSTRERTAILRACAQRMGDMWLAVFLPKRFDLAYAGSALRYGVTTKYEAQKQKTFANPQALVGTGPTSGDLLRAMDGATATGRAGPKGPSVTLRIPMPEHRLAQVVQEVLYTIPAGEVRAMAVEFDRRLGSLLKNANSSDPQRSHLTASQRQSSGLKTSRGRPAGHSSRRKAAEYV